MSVAAAAFASGSGTNLQALLNAEAEGAHFRVALVITDRECGAEDRARERGVPVARVSFKGRAAGETAGDVLEATGDAGAEMALLAGFLRLIPAAVVRAFPRRILNVHPALLPAFGGQGMYGLRVHQAVLASGACLSGPTVHYVDERYDEGSILAQWPVPVLPGDVPETLAGRVLEAEHRLFPAAADALARSVAAGTTPRFRWPGREVTPFTWQSLTHAFEIDP